jgi:hypothetical protein
MDSDRLRTINRVIVLLAVGALLAGLLVEQWRQVLINALLL